jgi:hypothetical protein
MQEKLKYPSIFEKIMNHSDLTLPLLTYLNFHHCQINDKKLISLILNIKNIQKKELIAIPFIKTFCNLVENIVSNYETEDLAKGVVDNYAVVQFFLSSIIVKWIQQTDQEFLSKNKVENLFNKILSFINEEYGDSYINILKLLKIFIIDEIKKDKPLPLKVINNAVCIIKNLHPNQFKSIINNFHIQNYNKLKKYGIEFPSLNPKNKNSFSGIFQNIENKLIVVDRMDKYNEITRLNFFLEFKGENKYLITINEILQNLRKDKLIDLDNIYQDIELTKENNRYLIEQNEKEKLKNKELINDCAEISDKCAEMSDKCAKMTDKCAKMTDQINKLQNKIKSVSTELKKSQEKKDELITELFNANLKIKDFEDKVNNYYHREACLKIEDYFYYILNPKGREIVDKEINENKKRKIDAYYQILLKEYPNYLEKIKNIDLYSFLDKVNNFRLTNNSDIHYPYKINKESLALTLNNYYNNEFKFDITLSFMYKNFEFFEKYLFKDNFELDSDLYKIFIEKEKMSKNK